MQTLYMSLSPIGVYLYVLLAYVYVAFNVSSSHIYLYRSKSNRHSPLPACIVISSFAGSECITQYFKAQGKARPQKTGKHLCAWLVNRSWRRPLKGKILCCVIMHAMLTQLLWHVARYRLPPTQCSFLIPYESSQVILTQLMKVLPRTQPHS